MEENIKNRAISGAIWTGIEKILRQVVQFIFGIILARLLDPSDYGVVGMLAIFMAIATTFTDSGMGSALIQKKDKSEDDYNTVFWFNLIVSIIFYVLLFIGAPYIADFYHLPILKEVTPVISITLVLGALSTVHTTRLSINLQFREQSIISIVSMIATGIIGIALAYLGYGVWALVFQNIASSLLTVILVWLALRWVPRLSFSMKSFRELFGFGSRILGSSLINTIYRNISTLVIGRLFSPDQIGYYNRGVGYAHMPTDMVQDMALKVNYPILAKLKDNNDQLLSAYKKLMSLPLYILYPILIGMVVTADPLISVMIGDKWLPCVPVMQILCIGCMFTPLTHLNLNLLYVKGRSDLVLRLELIKKPIGFALLLGLAPFGIVWMVVGQAVYSFIAFSFNCYYTGKILVYGEIKQLKVLLPIFINCIIMALVVYLSMLPFDTNYIKLIVGVTTGILSYLLYSIFTKDSCYIEIMNIVKTKILKK